MGFTSLSIQTQNQLATPIGSRKISLFPKTKSFQSGYQTDANFYCRLMGMSIHKPGPSCKVWDCRSVVGSLREPSKFCSTFAVTAHVAWWTWALVCSVRSLAHRNSTRKLVQPQEAPFYSHKAHSRLASYSRPPVYLLSSSVPISGFQCRRIGFEADKGPVAVPWSFLAEWWYAMCRSPCQMEPKTDLSGANDVNIFGDTNGNKKACRFTA